MSTYAKTIQIYLPQGHPRGIRSAEMTTRTVRVIEIPRVHVQEFLKMSDSAQVGLYFLVGSNEANDLPQLYIGQTGELRSRIQQHNLEKDFWERVFVMLSTNNTITQTHALYLEYKAIATAKNAERYELLNGNNGILPHTPAPLKADCEELFHTLSILLSTMGQPIFESLQNASHTIPAEKSKQLRKQTFYCKTSFADAKGYYDDDGFVILKDSLIRKDATNSLSKWAIENREALIQKGKLILYQDRYLKLTENHLFRTPSGAAQIVLGRPSNGWLEWVNSDGQTLDDVYRRPEC